MTLVVDETLLPGAWIQRAQKALDELSTMATVAQVEQRFGSVRALTETVLGYPVAGGHATRRAIRATGRALSHRLGPAVGAEALSWAASVIGIVDTSSIEELLESAAAAPAACRPLRLEDRHVLHQHLERFEHRPARRRALLSLFASRPSEIENPPSPPSHELYAYDSIRYDPDVVLWLAGLIDNDTTSFAGIPRPETVVSRIFRAATPEHQLQVFEEARWEDVGALAASHVLFDLPVPIVARCLLDHPALVLGNETCPAELRSRVRHPYDEATLELALRAGRHHFENLRVRRLLSELDTRRRAEYLEAIPVAYLSALRACDLIAAEDLLTGHLSGVDLTNRELAEAALGVGRQWHHRRMPAVVIEILARHPQAEGLAWLLHETPDWDLPAGAARRLVDQGAPAIATAAMRFLDPCALEARDAAVTKRGGAYWIARCPGIPAVERPPRSPVGTHDRYPPIDNARFWYPSDIAAVTDEPFEEAPGWSVRLPSTPAELRRNAMLMRNCTSGFTESIQANIAYLLIVHDPEGHRFNVAIHRTQGRLAVGQINSWGNGGIEPAWLRPALKARLQVH